MTNTKQQFKDKLTDILEENFPKGVSKERGAALVMFAEAVILMNELIEEMEGECDCRLNCIDSKLKLICKCGCHEESFKICATCCKPKEPKKKIEKLEYKPDSPWKEEYNYCSPHNRLLRKINEIIDKINSD